MKVDNTEKAFKKFGANVIHRAKFYLERRKKNTKSATLSNSLGFNVKVYPSGSLEMNFRAEDYFKYVEEGRQPGSMPPSSAIAKWINEKPIKIRNSKGQYAQKTDANVNSAAFGIAMHIKSYGIKPSWFFRDAFSMHRKRLAPEIVAAYGKDAAKMMRNILGKKYTK